MKRPTLLICNRYGSKSATPGSTIGTCSRCGALVHVAPSSRLALKRWPHLEVVCMACLGGGEIEAIMTPEQRRELVVCGSNPRTLDWLLNDEGEYRIERTAKGDRLKPEPRKN